MCPGLRILDRNWRCAEGEIDIVAAGRQVLVICEVQTRSSAQYGSPLEAITRSKRARSG
jgi:putative endonuclease